MQKTEKNVEFVKKSARDAEDMTQAARVLAEADINTLEEIRRSLYDALDGAASGEKTASAGTEYAIVTLDNGMSYVKAERKIISGNNVSEWRKQITKFFNKLLANGGKLDVTTIDGETLTITKKTKEKARDNRISENGITRMLSNNEFAVKLRAESHIDELAETAPRTKLANVKDTKNHSFAKTGFNYRTVYFEDFDGQYYKIRLSIGENNGISTVYDVGKAKADSIPTGNIVSVVGSKADMLSADSTVSQEDTESQDYSMQKTEKNVEFVKKSARDTEYTELANEREELSDSSVKLSLRLDDPPKDRNVDYIVPVNTLKPEIDRLKSELDEDTAEALVRNQTGLSYRSYAKDSGMSEYGHAMFADSIRMLFGYGKKNPKIFSVAENQLTNINDLRDAIIAARNETELPEYVSELSDDEFFDMFNPTDIVDSAVAFDDDDMTQWFWDNVLEPKNIAGVKTEDGAVVFDNSIMSRNLPMEVYFQNNPNYSLKVEDVFDEYDYVDMPQVRETVEELKTHLNNLAYFKLSRQDTLNMADHLLNEYSSKYDREELAEELRMTIFQSEKTAEYQRFTM